MKLSTERWIIRELKPGDMIRTFNGRIYHFGIYTGQNQVIHFAGDTKDRLTDSSCAKIRTTTLDDFSFGSVEVRGYTMIEKIQKRPRKKVIQKAMSCIGQCGYDIIYNNCEHFANRCVFGRSFSTQIDNMRTQLNNIRQ